MATKPNYRLSSLAALLLACGGTTTENAPGEGISTSSDAELLACTTANASSGFSASSLGSHSGRIRVDLDATPSSSPGDALVGLAEFAPSRYTHLAAIARFNADGEIDARDGSSYRATSVVPYEAGRTRHLRFELDTATHRYSLSELRGSAQVAIAQNFAFRSEQQNALGIGALGVKVDEGGPLSVCNVLVADGSCMSAGPYEGFVNAAFSPQQTFVTIGFDATPSSADIDAVLGVSAGAASSFNDIAAAVRFNPDGTVDVRDGNAYRTSSGVVTYSAGTSYRFQLLIDVQLHRYTVLFNGTRIAEDFAFRTPQAGVTSLGNLVLVSDGESGAVSRCSVTLDPARDSVYLHTSKEPASTFVPLPDGRVLLVEESRTLVLDTAGVPSGELPFTGPLAVDGAGHLYRSGTFSGTFDSGAGPLTSAGGTDAYLIEYDAAWNPIWSARFGGEGDDSVWPPIGNAGGDVLLVVNGQAMRLDPGGNVVYDGVPIAASAKLALDASGNLFASDNPSVPGHLSIMKLGPDGNTLWTRDMPILEGGAQIDAIAADATGGVVFAGEIQGYFDLGGVTFGINAHEDGRQTYIAKLDADGAYVYASTTNISDFQGLTVDALGNAAVSGTHVNPFRARVDQFGPDGAFLREVGGESLIEPIPFGTGAAAGSDAAGNLYLRFYAGPYDVGSFIAKVRAL